MCKFRCFKWVFTARDTSFDINGDLDVSTEFDTFLEDEERRMSSLHNSDFERDELLCKSEVIEVFKICTNISP